MDKIIKFFKTLTKKEKEGMLLIFEQIDKEYTKIPGIKPLSGKRGWFRVRMGTIRIIFSVDKKRGKTEIQKVTRRDEKTYKNI